MPKSEMKQKKPKRSETYFLVLWNEAKRKRNVFFALFRFEAKNKRRKKMGHPSPQTEIEKLENPLAFGILQNIYQKICLS